VDSLGSIDYAGMLTVSTLIKPFSQAEDETYEEVDLSLIDTNSMTPEEISQLMAKKRKADMMKERDLKRKENLEEANKQAALQKEGAKTEILKSKDGIIYVFGNETIPFTGYIDTIKKEYIPIRVPNQFKPYSDLKIHRLLDKTCLLLEETTKDRFPREDIIHFDPRYWTFEPLPRRTKRVFDSELVQLGEDKLYLVGGRRRTATPLLSNHVEVYSFADGRWRVLASMLKSRLKFACYAWEKAIYAVGGANTDNELESSIERYDVNANVWELLEFKFTTAVYNGLPVVRKNDVLILGGLTKTTPLDTVYSVCVLHDVPPRCSFVKNLPILKSVTDARVIDLGTAYVLVYTERGREIGAGRRVARYLDLDTVDIGPELEVDVAAQLARLGVDARAFG
jgi:hypothetical protein